MLGSARGAHLLLLLLLLRLLYVLRLLLLLRRRRRRRRRVVLHLLLVDRVLIVTVHAYHARTYKLSKCKKLSN